MTIDRRRMLAMAAAALAPTVGSAVPSKTGSNDSVLPVLRTQSQALADAVSEGNAAVWERLLHAACVYTSEDGEVSDKKQMVAQIEPLPSGVSGHLKVIDFRARVEGPIAITNYVLDEDENYHGHALHCQYRNTDTWLKTPAGWRLVAAQVLALRTDPASVPISRERADEYVGRYVLSPEIAYEVRRKPIPPPAEAGKAPEPPAAGEASLEGQQTGRPAKDLRAEAPDILFVPGLPRYRYVFLRDAAGKITGLAQRREAWDLVWKRDS